MNSKYKFDFKVPILNLKDRILLPGFFLNLKFTSERDVALVERYLWKQALSQARSNLSPGIVPCCIFVEGSNVGCLARVLKIERLASSSEASAEYFVVLEGVQRCAIKQQQHQEIDIDGNSVAYIETLSSITRQESKDEISALEKSLKLKVQSLLPFLRQFKVNSVILERLSTLLNQVGVEMLVDILTSIIDFKLEQKVSILSELDLAKRLVLFNNYLIEREQKSPLSSSLSRFNFRSKSSSSSNLSNSSDELEELYNKIQKANLPDTVKAIVDKEFQRLKKIQSAQHEYVVSRTFLEWVADLPWSIKLNDCLDLQKAKKQLDSDHYGLSTVKKRVLQFLAVRKLRKEISKASENRPLRSPVLCFVGSPGIGKTSLGKSIAAALDRKCHRIALGGVRDVADIKGHRRTYVGSLPGLIIQGLKQVGCNNPVFILDEIDKLGSDLLRGDPSAALLEVLDPEQNYQFVDHYLGIPFDLSDVLFICTANDLRNIPPALLDRMEVIEMNGYTLEDKLKIARFHLIPKLSLEHGIEPTMIELDDQSLNHLITSYTREPGVRSLERQLAGICRSIAIEIAENSANKAEKYIITPKLIEEYLGPIKYDGDILDSTNIPGIVCGLSWISSGNGSLLIIETTLYPGTGKLNLTGNLGEVIKESAQTAYSWVKANCHLLPIKIPSFVGNSHLSYSDLFSKIDIHVHIPSGAISKEGPSAGIALASAMISLLTGIPCQPKLAMTGEITLRGLVLPVGGVPEKYLAAHRSGVKKVIIPDRNRKDLTTDEISENVKNETEIISVKTMKEVVRFALGIEMQVQEQNLSEKVMIVQRNSEESPYRSKL